jgi:replicative DNA helicase
MLEMADAGKQVDFIAMTQFLRDRGLLDQAGGPSYITELFTYLPTAENARHYTEILLEKHSARELIKVCTEFASRGYEEQDNVEGLIDGAEAAVLAIREQNRKEIDDRPTKDIVMEVLHAIEEKYDNRGKCMGLSTGFTELDEITDGLQPANLILIAARPSMGKTAIGMDIALHCAVNLQKSAAFFTAEMSDRQLIQRAVLSTARVNMHSVNRGFLTDGDFPKITMAASKISASKLRVVDCNSSTIQAVRAKARRIKRRFPDLALIVIDYLQYLRSNSRQAQNSREREVAEISAGCKSIAKELNIPVVVLAQLNREAEKRKGEAPGRPRMSDLRESGAIEQDADVVGLLYREEYYAENEEQKREAEGKATLIIAKNRSGPVGDVPLTFVKEFTTFENRARDLDREPAQFRPHPKSSERSKHD